MHDDDISPIRSSMRDFYLRSRICYQWNRHFQIKSKDVKSSRRKISAGVPQGSIIGPFLYLLFSANMPTSHDLAFLSTHSTCSRRGLVCSVSAY